MHLFALSNHVRQTSFEDAANTFTSSCLLGPPTVEYAPYGRIPSGKRRTDARQGTIDLDPEFMDFLESLANPAPTKEEETDAAKAEKVTTTPLVQYLKDKKASKTKDSGPSKGSRSSRNEQGSSSRRVAEGTESPKKRESKKEKLEREKVDKEKLAEATRAAVAAVHSATAKLQTRNGQGQASSANTPTEPPKNRERAVARERGSIAAAARILQRDLGLTPGNAHRRAKAEAESPKSDASTAAINGNPNPPNSRLRQRQGPDTSANTGRNRGRIEGNAPTGENNKPKAAPPTPMVLLKKPVDNAAAAGSSGSSASTSRPLTPAARPANTPQPAANVPPSVPAALNKPSPQIINRRQPAQPVPSAGATQAFVKHANPSQGVTELLLKEAMETFGAVSRVEIDKRKGFAYVDFVDSDSLKKAMAANPTRIAQGTVQVLERKDGRRAGEQTPRAPQNQSHGSMRGGGSGSAAGGGNNNNNNNNGPPRGPSGGGGGGRGPPRRGRGRNTGGGGGSGAAGSAAATLSGPATPVPSGPAAAAK